MYIQVEDENSESHATPRVVTRSPEDVTCCEQGPLYGKSCPDWCIPAYAGQDLDDVFSYGTSKTVKIRDRRLGYIKMFFMTCIFLYIVVWQMLCNNQHMEVGDVRGVVRMQLQHPTAHHCNPHKPTCMSNYTKLSELPYCKQYKGKDRPHVRKETCEYRDEYTLSPLASAGTNSFFATTRVSKHEQQRDCDPFGEVCTNTFMQTPRNASTSPT
mmetsp:Transcript_30681/g.76190  ORF Transcript_30681/g.76190 Transcript_30681/m.76190 type:complete len:213 (-) Transcript_30681:1465-2103(-)